MASTDPAPVGTELNFINSTPADFLQGADGDSRDVDDDMRSVSSESDGLEYATPTPNNNITHMVPHQCSGESHNKPENDIYANGVPGRGWDGSGFDTAPEIQAQELLMYMREVSQWADTFAFMHPRQVDHLLQLVFALCKDVLQLQEKRHKPMDAEHMNTDFNITGILRSLTRELNEVKMEIARINKTNGKGN
jgi:hypothetical protein